jgi:geranylgeranyl reductase family protein
MTDTSPEFIETDIAIVGAGPAGCAAALSLKHSGRRVLLLDKAEFPREKTCGDSIPAASMLNLENIDPGIYNSFLQTVPHNSFRSSSLVFPSGKSLQVHWPLPGYLVYRNDFDAFLLDRVKAANTSRILTGLKAVDYGRFGNFFRIGTRYGESEGPEIICSRIIGADGAPSLAARKLTGSNPDQSTYGHAIRCYYEDVPGMDNDTELIFMHPDFFPGYFWLFPMADGRVNAGYGMPEKWRKRSGMPLPELFTRFIKEHPVVREMLSGSRQVTPIKGGMVPFAMKWQPCSGPGFYLAGDAASLVDPLSGDGIQYAIKSGILAGAHAEKDLINSDWDHQGGESEYDRLIRKYIWNRMKSGRRLIPLLTAAPALMRIAEACAGNAWFKRKIRNWI